MKELDATGKTLEEAKKSALEQLGAEEDQVEFTVLKKGRSGLLGMGAGETKVHARLLDEKLEEETQPGATKDEKVEKRIDISKSSEIANEAKDVLANLMNLMGLEGKIRIIPETQDSPMTLDLDGEDLGILIGRRGQTLSSLQYVVRLIVSEKAKAWTSFHVDIAGYKKRRYESLKKLALRLADQVKITKRSINLEPMPPDERRIIHITLADDPEISTQSTEVGEKRKVVIQYRKR